MSEVNDKNIDSAKDVGEGKPFVPKIDDNPIKRYRSDDDKKESESTTEAPSKKLKIETNESKDETNNSNDENAIETLENSQEKEPLTETKPKFVFGSTSIFGSGFALAKSDAAKKENKKTDEKIEEKQSPTLKPYSFGSGFSFGGGFNVLKNKETSLESKQKDDDTTNSNEESSVKSEAIKDDSEAGASESKSNFIKLEKQDLKSGEELETLLHQVNAKLYQLTDIDEGWKERGIGLLKINKNSENRKARLVMRSRVLLKVILNLPLMKEFKISKGFPGSLQTEKFVRIIAVNEEKIPVQYAFKLANADSADDLYSIMEKEMLK
ncbi:hypothetical protein TPHA_0J00940 [Tetrapisispora phaffii CBS 4417]|uniref:RanBD1 domain-containing protein n=1 Tax=Tetrapisispora phaffii (strain ATCC 24235 / CBS 4417 / NBRC 1672 / NRRL Y-8282 / UCD 70-5) TaxID=1071381 RepID=G8BYH4_TETPH|nr:hypothetical protein TPHA_0J00940 [Tetrapisispora phaffii CBS 4417]CCE64916.1 hypothetical protein TPHA_0J00940 [Tetrapisispora phaffii CBS 4417]